MKFNTLFRAIDCVSAVFFHTKQLVTKKARGRSFSGISVLALSVAAQGVNAYQIPANATNTWVVNAGVAQKSTPSGVRVNVSLTGIVGFSALNNTALMAGSGAAGAGAGTFLTPALPAATNGLQLLTSQAAANSLATTCQATNPNDLRCNNFGTVTVNFTDSAGQPIAVRNPVMHLSRVAGRSTSGSNAVYFGVIHTLTSAGATLLAPSSGSVGLSVSGADVLPVVSTSFDGNCPAAGGTVTAGCGSIPITGTVSTLSFNIAALRHSTAANAPWNTLDTGADGWFITFSFDEDFGDAPASFQAVTSVATTAPASHILSNLALGSAFTAANNNTTTLNGTAAGAGPFSASPVQVAAGANNTGAAGDGAEEDGLTTPLAVLTTDKIGSTYTLTPSLSGATRSGQVCGWIDFNRDGVFTAAEGTCSPFSSGASSAPLNWTVPTATTAGTAYVRVRASYDSTMTTASFNGLLNSGEVEDYWVEIKPAVKVNKVVTPGSAPGTFNLAVAGTNFASAVGNGGTTNFKSVYHTDSPDVTVVTNVANAAITGLTVSESIVSGGTFNSTYSCVNATGATVASGTGVSTTISIPQSITGASANGRAQTITCTFTNAPTSDIIAAVSVPAVSAPGGTVNGTITCTAANGTALNATCGATALDSSGAAIPVTVTGCTPTPPASVPVGTAISCNISYTMPGTPGGSDTVPTGVTVTATASASNDTNATNNVATGATAVIDAVDDAAGYPGGTLGATTSLGGNDTFPVGSTFTKTGGTCANSSVATTTGIATYDVPASGTCTVTYSVCAPGGTPCDNATMTVTATPSDMVPVFSGFPATSAPGSVVTGTITCTNAISGSPTASATQATCNATAVDNAGNPIPVTVSGCSKPTPVASLAVGDTIVCAVSYTTPGTPGGSDTLATSVALTGVTGSINDVNSGNNTTPAIVPIIDAVDDSVGKPGGTVGAQTNLFPNDTYPSGSTFSIEPGGTCASASVSAAGVATYNVPNSGSCTVKYKVCSAAPVVCDTATLTVTASAADMIAEVSAPAVSAPGALITGQITCTNAASSATSATNATCSATAVDNGGNVVPVTVSGCVPTPPTSVAIGAKITCNVTYTTPGTTGGTDTTPTSVTLTAVTGAANDSNPGNNTAPVSVPIIDAVDDAPGYPGGTLGATTPLGSNDQFPVGSLFTKTGGTCANATVSLSGLATYDVPALGSCTVTYSVCAPAPNALVCDTATMTVTSTPADMKPSFSGLPTTSAPGSTVSGTLTCTNVISPAGGGSATQATCGVTALDSAGLPVVVTVGTCVPTPPADIAVGGTIICPISYQTPGSLGGGDTTPTTVTLTGSSTSVNDNNVGNTTTPAIVGIIDALDDGASYPGGLTGVSTSVAGNDQFPPGSLFTLESGGTCPNPSVSPSGLATYDVVASGICTVLYKVCAPAPNATQCDTATLTVTSTPSDMTASVSVPVTAAPGASVTGTITCTNNLGTAVGATCSATALDSNNANVPVVVSGCVPTPPATLANGSVITCNVAYTMPGTQGGADTSQTSVVVTAVTSAINDNVPTNNTGPGSTVIVDALDDTASGPGGTTGATSNVSVNDQRPLNSTFKVTGGTCANTAPNSPATNTSGVLTYDIPSAGTCTVVYEVCAPSPNQSQCDTATLTVTAVGAEISAAISGLPAVSAPGSTVNGQIECSVTSGTATGVTCTATAQDSTGANVPVTVGTCTPPMPATSVANGTVVTCNISYITPGSPGGSDTLPNNVTVTAQTGATNDLNGTNNSAVGVVPIIDAVDDAAGYPGGTLGATTTLNGNDNVPPGSIFTKTGGTCANSTITGATATYDVPASGTCTVVYQVCAAGGSPCDTATMTVTATPSDMKPTFSGLPTMSSPGSTVSGTITCTNVITGSPTAPATQASCSASAVDSLGNAVPVSVTGCTPSAPAASLAVGASITCSVSYTVPGVAGGADTTPTSVALAGLTGALNDNNAGNDSALANVPIIDAVNDSVGQPGGTIGAQANVATNDQFPAGSVFTLEPSGTCSPASISGSTVTYNVPGSGSCTVNYKVCAPAPNGSVCDTATLTVIASPADMVALAEAPSTGAPGSTVTGKITCTNAVSSSTTATAATCSATAQDSTGANVPVTVSNCTPAPGVNLGIGESIVCDVSYIMPGPAGGTDTTPTSVTLTASTGAANDSNTGNNTFPVITTIIDAVNDTAGAPGGSVGETTSLSANDQVPPGSSYTIASGSTCPNSSVSLLGVATYDVPASGSCTVNYKVCAPNPNQAQCDTATLTVTAGASDMSAAVNGLPAVSAPGSTVTGSITCSATGGVATSATCSASAVDSTGAVVPVSVTNCTPTLPATLSAGSAITCDLSYVTPGTLGGADTAPTAVIVTAATTATNDGNAANNTASGSVPIIDAVDDNPGFPGGTVGATTSLGGNDGYPSGSVFTQTGGTCAAASINSSTGVATYNVPNSGSCTIQYRVCSGTVCDIATMTVTATPADMKPTFSNLPVISAPGATVSGKLTCTNVIAGAGSSSATGATCNATAVDSTGAPVAVSVSNCTPTPPANVAVGASIVCDVSYTVPGTAGGTDTVPTSVTLTGLTSSANDNNAGNDTTALNIPIIDAVNDAVGQPGGTTGAQANVGSNDSFPLGSTFALAAGSTCSAVSMAGSTATYNVPASGSCTVNYKVCAPSPNQLVCDTATLTVTATVADMATAVSVPSAAAPGATVTGSITCTNSAGSATTATAATCTATAVDSAGIPVVVTVGTCTPPAPAANLAIGAAITCPISYTMPGTLGGSDTAPTSVTVTAATSATNDANTGNNTAKALTSLVDAVDDTDSALSGATGQSSTLAPNDQVPPGSNYTLEPGSTCANPAVSSSGVATYDVPLTGTCTVKYKVCAPAPNATQCDTAALTVTSVPPGAPVATNDASTTPINKPITVSVPVTNNDTGTGIKVRDLIGKNGATCPVKMSGLFKGDQSKAGSACTVAGLPGKTCTVATANGSITMCEDGTYTYTPNTGFEGVDSVTYEIVDNTGQSTTARIDITVAGRPDVITKVTLPSAAPAPGAPLTVQVSAGNIGPVEANGVVVTLQMPTNLTGVSPSNGGVYDPATGIVTWPAIPVVAANSPNSIAYTVSLPMPSGGPVSFTSSASVPGGETSTSNNNSSASIGEAISVPTLSFWMLILLMLATLGFGSRTLRRIR